MSGKAFKNSLFFIFGNITSLFQFINNQSLTLTLGTVGCLGGKSLCKTKSFKEIYL